MDLRLELCRGLGSWLNFLYDDTVAHTDFILMIIINFSAAVAYNATFWLFTTFVFDVIVDTLSFTGSFLALSVTAASFKMKVVSL